MVNDSTRSDNELLIEIGDQTAEITLTGEQTSVDLAADLLDKTRTLTLELKKEHETSQECIETARILYAEGLQDEAKRLCRRALILDPGFTPALHLLKTIHDRELQILLDDDIDRSRGTGVDLGSESLSPSASAELIRQLDRDLKLGLLKETSLFQDLVMTPDSITSRDRLDVAIGLMGMELWDLALVQLKLIQKEATQGLTNEKCLRSALAMMAETFLQMHKPYDAMAIIQPILRDAEVEEVHKLEFFHLMGRAHEELNEFDTAFQWYTHILKTDEAYRDSFDRHRRLLLQISANRTTPGRGQ